VRVKCGFMSSSRDQMSLIGVPGICAGETCGTQGREESREAAGAGRGEARPCPYFGPLLLRSGVAGGRFQACPMIVVAPPRPAPAPCDLWPICHSKP
jgi:hypothetical protein